tara:strand:- start:571 stop:1242 length:672 start_codon:yes stop_codon:yes gene_type:complete
MVSVMALATTLAVVLAGSVLLATIYDELVDWVGFDRRYRIDTGIIGRIRGSVAGGIVHRGYMPTPVRTLRSLLSALPIDPADYTLVDLGSGKGRVLIVGAESGFRHCIGVEHVPALCETSVGNLSDWRLATGATTPIDVVGIDAATYEFPQTPLVVFLYNPFSRAVMAEVARNLSRSHAACPRRIIVVAVHPRYRSVFAALDFLRPLDLPAASVDFFTAFDTV